MARSGPGHAVSSERWSDAAGRIAGAVALVRAQRDGAWFGAMADVIAPVSSEPPILMVCLPRDSPTGADIDRTGKFVVDLLGEDHLDLAYTMAEETERLASPPPEDFLAQLGCTVTERVTSASHIIFLGLAERVEVADGRPLASYRGGFGRLEPIGF